MAAGRLQPPGLGIEVDLSLPSARVIRSLEQIIEWRAVPVRFDRAGAGQGHRLVMDLQSRAPEHGTRGHHTHAESCTCCIAPLLVSATNGGIILQSRFVDRRHNPKIAEMRWLG